MTLTELREKGWIIYEVISGSHAYGTSTPESDVDHRGVFQMPTTEMLGTTYYPQIGDEKQDSVFYEIGRFLELLSNGNPNVLELLNVPDRCVVYKDPLWDKVFSAEIKQKFVTRQLKDSFMGYAWSQLKKAKGLDKLMNWETERVERKDVLDFCYVIPGREESIPFKHWESKKHKQRLQGHGPKTIYHPTWVEYIPGFEPVDEIIHRANIGLSAVNNVPDLYSMYFMEVGGGIISDNSDDVQLRSIPKGAPFISYLSFNKNGYSTHCADFRKYQEWLNKRNTQRYVDVESHGQRIDGKNLMHLVRLLNTAGDIAAGKGVVVERPEVEYLLEIRRGKHDLQSIIDTAESKIEGIRQSFDSANLPEKVDPKFIDSLLKEIRLHSLGTFNTIFDVILKAM